MTDPVTRGVDLDLTWLSEALSGRGIRVGARRISLGDEATFACPGSIETASNLARRRAGGSARIVARRLIGEIGGESSARLRRSPSGAPVWPEGVIGSLAHDDDMAVAAVALRRDIACLGIDVEPAEPLPYDVVSLVLSVEEQRLSNNKGVTRRLIFSSKEAVYKAVNGLDGSRLDYADIEIRLADNLAQLRDGRSLRLLTHARDRLVAVAFA